jgi:hypothetical protein
LNTQAAAGELSQADSIQGAQAMKKSAPHELTVAELVDHFAAICAQQNKALFDRAVGRFNRLYDQMDAVRNGLETREGDQRRALLSLFNHPDLQVRLQAAKTTLAIAPAAARQMLEALERWGRQPQAGDAGMCLINLERGIFVPK